VKAKKGTRGHPYGEGLFGWATNVNYGAYKVWRTRYALDA
jgi:hypothetical protein